MENVGSKEVKKVVNLGEEKEKEMERIFWKRSKVKPEKERGGIQHKRKKKDERGKIKFGQVRK